MKLKSFTDNTNIRANPLNLRSIEIRENPSDPRHLRSIT